MIYINNRRYIGNKHKLLPYILNDITNNILTEQYSFADLFAGTGVVAHSIAKKGNPVIVNDILYSNMVAYKAWLSDKEYREDKITELISYFNNLNYSEINDNYFSEIYGNKYFSCNDAKKIGYIRDFIESNKKNYTEREYFILLTILLYATDKIANTVGHFEYFLKKQPVDSFFQLSNLQLENLSNVEIFNEDANILAKKINADVVYIDPPYNARQYVNFYHVLENLARWNKPRIINIQQSQVQSIIKGLRLSVLDNYNFTKPLIPSYTVNLVNTVNMQVAPTLSAVRQAISQLNCPSLVSLLKDTNSFSTKLSGIYDICHEIFHNTIFESGTGKIKKLGLVENKSNYKKDKYQVIG